jgi:hypothetical protein
MAAKIDEQTLTPLTRDEIGRRMDRLATVVATQDEGRTGASPSNGDPSEPQWIRPADLVRRMRPYLVYN